MYQHPESFSDLSTRKISSADMDRIQSALESAILNASSPLPAPTAWVSIHKNKPRRSATKQAQGTSIEQPKTIQMPTMASLSAIQADTIPCASLPCPADIDDLLPTPSQHVAPTVCETEETESVPNADKMPIEDATSNDVPETPDASSVSVVVAVDVVVSDSPPPVRTLQRQKINPNQIHKSTPHAITLPLSGRAVWIAALALLGAIGGLLAQTW